MDDRVFSLNGVSAEGTLTVTMGREDYERLLGYTRPPAASFTFTRTVLADPNLRRPGTWRGVLRQMWDIVVWEFRGAADLPRESDSVTTGHFPTVYWTTP